MGPAAVSSVPSNSSVSWEGYAELGTIGGTWTSEALVLWCSPFILLMKINSNKFFLSL
jgi:hypothetical protein